MALMTLMTLKTPMTLTLVILMALLSRPLRNHVINIEKQLTTLIQERRGQLAELFELK